MQGQIYDASIVNKFVLLIANKFLSFSDNNYLKLFLKFNIIIIPSLILLDYVENLHKSENKANKIELKFTQIQHMSNDFKHIIA
jgi:hypothetical protein